MLYFVAKLLNCHWQLIPKVFIFYVTNVAIMQPIAHYKREIENNIQSNIHEDIDVDRLVLT